MGDSLENKVNQHSDRFYFNKEFLIGQVCGVAAGVAVAQYLGSDAENSKSYVSLMSMSADFVAFNLAYIQCMHNDKKQVFPSKWDFLMYLAKVTVCVTLPAGVVHRLAHFSAMYYFQKAGLGGGLSAALAYIPSTAVFLGVANVIGSLKKDLISGKSDDKYLKPSSSA